MTNKDIMVDIETLGTGNHALILSIGAVPFHLSSGFIGGPKLWVLDWTDYPQMVDQFDQSPVTFHWWLQQSDDARHHFNMPKTAVARALAEFRDMVGERNVWGNGSTFDNVILHHAMRTFGHEQWSFRRDMCYRTIRNLAHNVGYKPEGKNPNKHDPVADAVYQAEELIAMWRFLRGNYGYGKSD